MPYSQATNTVLVVCNFILNDLFFFLERKVRVTPFRLEVNIFQNENNIHFLWSKLQTPKSPTMNNENVLLKQICVWEIKLWIVYLYSHWILYNCILGLHRTLFFRGVIQANLNKKSFPLKTRPPLLIVLIGCAAGLKQLIGRSCQNSNLLQVS